MSRDRVSLSLGAGLLLSFGVLISVAPARATDLVNSLVIPGESTDLTSTPGANGNRLGFFSDLYFDRYQNVYYGLSDRGPGGGVYSYDTRVQKLTLSVNPTQGKRI